MKAQTAFNWIQNESLRLQLISDLADDGRRVDVSRPQASLMFLTGMKSWPDVFTLYRSIITLMLYSKQEQPGCKILIFSFDKTKEGDKMGCHGTSRVLMAVTQWHHYQDTMCLLREEKESRITRAPTGRSLILRWFLQPSVCVSLHQCLKLWTINCKNRLGQEGEIRVAGEREHDWTEYMLEPWGRTEVSSIWFHERSTWGFLITMH